MFAKKIEFDGDELRIKLRDMVANQIKVERQPYRSEITLTVDQKSPNYMFGAAATTIIHKTNPFEKKIPPQYIYAVNQPATDWIEISNSETQMLIDAAIIPLDLKWRINNNFLVVISWKHWVQALKTSATTSPNVEAK